MSPNPEASKAASVPRKVSVCVHVCVRVTAGLLFQMGQELCCLNLSPAGLPYPLPGLEVRLWPHSSKGPVPWDFSVVWREPRANVMGLAVPATGGVQSFLRGSLQFSGPG